MIEVNQTPSTILTFAYLGNALAQNLGASTAAYVSNNPAQHKLPFTRLWYWPLFYAFWKSVSSAGRLYRSFGVKNLFLPGANLLIRKEAEHLTRSFFLGLPTKKDLECLEVKGVLVGDLFYDTFLSVEKRATIESLESLAFRRYLKDCIADTLFWIEQIKSGKVRAVIVNHSVYNLAILQRVALQFGIPTYQAGSGSVTKLTRDQPKPLPDFASFREAFASLPNHQKSEGVADAVERIKRRFSGEVGIDMPYSKMSAFSKNRIPRVLGANSKTKVLIATHCFSDAPHFYGQGLFPDFWEWLVFLGDVAERTEYEWYLKVHPDCITLSQRFLDQLRTKYPFFSIVPASTSHHQLIAEGISAALTVYGTIGFEYAALGVPVINASLNNPHIAYNFNYHPQTPEELEELIHRIPSLNKPNSDAVAEYYFMRNIFNQGNSFFSRSAEAQNTEMMPDSVALISGSYKEFWEGWDEKTHEGAAAQLDQYLKAGARTF